MELGIRFHHRLMGSAVEEASNDTSGFWANHNLALYSLLSFPVRILLAFVMGWLFL